MAGLANSSRLSTLSLFLSFSLSLFLSLSISIIIQSSLSSSIVFNHLSLPSNFNHFHYHRHFQSSFQVSLFLVSPSFPLSFSLFLLSLRRGSRSPSGRCRRRRCCRHHWRGWEWAALEVASLPPPPRCRASWGRLPRGWRGSHRSYCWMEILEYIISDQGRLANKMTSSPYSSTHLIE